MGWLAGSVRPVRQRYELARHLTSRLLQTGIDVQQTIDRQQAEDAPHRHRSHHQAAAAPGLDAVSAWDGLWRAGSWRSRGGPGRAAGGWALPGWRLSG